MAGESRHGDVTRFFPGATEAICDGLHGWVTVESPDRVTAQARCPLCARDKVTAALVAFIPPRFRAPIALPDAVTAWVERADRAQGLYLAGQVGTGKTHTAWMALRKWCEQTGTSPRPERRAEDTQVRFGPDVIFTRMTDLLDDLRPGDDARRRVRDCQQASLLVLDDIGAEKASEWTQERLYSIVDHRYANCMPLLVTSNLPPAKLAEQTGDRAASRLAEMCEVVAMTGTDRRRPAA